MYRTLVPGLTNVTNRLRYYSYYCWVVDLFARIRHADDDRQWRVFIRRAEALYAIACESVAPKTSQGLAGANWAGRHWASLRGDTIDLRPFTDAPGEPRQYLQAKAGNFGQFYVRSMLEVGLLQPSSGVPLVSTERGRPLAAAFSAAIGDSVAKKLEHAIDAGTVTKRSLVAIGEVVHPSRIRGGSTEMGLLRDFLWATNPNSAGDTNRRLSAWLLLDLAAKNVPISDGTAVRKVFYERMLPDAIPYDFSNKVIDRWRAYQANELCHIALEAWLNRIAAALLADSVKPDRLIAVVVSEAIPKSVREQTFGAWAAEVALTAEFDEHSLSLGILEALRRPKKAATDPQVLLLAAQLVSLLWSTWSSGASGVRNEIAEFAVRGGSSLVDVLTTLTEFEDATTERALGEVLRRHVINGHLAIAARKLAASGIFTYRLLLENGWLSDGEVAPYGYTNPRLTNLAQFLEDARLIDENGRLTPAGYRYLNDV